MNKRMAIMLSALAAIFGGIIAFNIIKSMMMGYFFAHYHPPAITVSSVTATLKNWKPTLHAVGNFTAVNGVNVTSQAAGTVTAIHFESGQTVAANQPLIDIDDRVDQATLKSNQADLAFQKINYQRQLELLKTNVTSTSNVDEARAKLLEAEANVEKTLTLIDQKHIRSPFAGQLGLREVNIGEYISPGQTPVVSLQSLEPLYVDFFLPEQRLNQLHLGQIVTANLTPYPNLRFVGKITAINSKADTETHNVKVQATFSNCPEAALQDPLHSNLLDAKAIDSTAIQIQCDSARNQANHLSHYAFIPGMFTSLDIEQPPLPKTLVLPSTSISYSLYGNSVFVIQKEKDDYFVKQRFVKTGEQQGNETVIMSGIESGQLVVSSGELKLQNGTRIVINNDIDLSNATPIDQLGE